MISVFNVRRFPEIHDALVALRPDLYITEVAEERDDRHRHHASAPGLRDGRGFPDGAHEELAALRLRLDHRRVPARVLRPGEAHPRRASPGIPCYAGLTSCHIAADGDVWGCCIRAEPLGNLRDVDYDFSRIWHARAASAFRRSVKDRECECPMANASYTNMLMDPASLSRVGVHVLRSAAWGLARSLRGRRAAEGVRAQGTR